MHLISNEAEWNALLPDIPNHTTLHFEPHFGWKGHIELMPERKDKDYQASLSPLMETAHFKT